MMQEDQLNIIIWDLAGGEDFSGHDKNYLRGAAGALLVCDLTRKESLEYLSNYAEKMRESNPKARFVVAANKSDLADEKSVQDSDLDRVCQLLSSPYIVTSAKTGENVEKSIYLLAELLVNRSEVDRPT
jgi:small GTP-binding protein